jgi:hypothetical protein
MKASRGRHIAFAATAWVVLASGVGFAGTALAASESCPNATFRVGPSASLPDCRAYELVTPANLGRTQDMTFSGLDSDHAIPSSDGESIALESLAALEPNPSTSASVIGTHAVFLRTRSGWEMTSATTPGTGADRLTMSLLSPDLSMVALTSYTLLNYAELSGNTLEVGPVGGPYVIVANVPNSATTNFLGANAGTAGVRAFSHILFASTDHELLPPGAERALAEETVAGEPDLYDWTEGHLQLVNVEGAGSQLRLVDQCGASLGAGGGDSAGAGAAEAISDDGSKIIFTTPRSGVACKEPSRLFMRVEGRETVEVSEPEGVALAPSERHEVYYDGATPDGSEVFFNTDTPLTAGETPQEQGENKLFEYDTEEPEGKRLKLIASGFAEADHNGPSRYVVISEDGSTVYFESGGTSVFNIYRYDTRTGTTGFVATAKTPEDFFEPSYTTPNGEFLLFAAWGEGGVLEEDGIEHEPRGAHHNELYRYDAADGSVMCVSCGEGYAPANGEMFEPKSNTPLETEDETPPLIPMSENGQEVFFQTSAQLVPQDSNVTPEGERGNDSLGQDVYEWEADGNEEAPGVVCRETNGCTHLLSSGEDVGPAVFLGASRDGSNVFFSTAAQLTPQATPEFTNIYDARVDGGFAPHPAAPECLSCQGVGSLPPLFSPGASGTFKGPGNPAAPTVKAKPKPKGKLKHRKRRKGKSKGARRDGAMFHAGARGRRS